ncbi:alpha-E domain-containing protein [Paralimibaculum aggregatum]|uniref:Alpha-E domain-containing protein n=1 Tax=Paralimibaculum aggregatum TaxID=3036245 RepID=A0ABQ6LU23_9RHOB|nr:alpha-E domain-containing protein [Limibaculum sp. NKW23]GMG85580.1 alpha-E domain-containing protein [Limibaculum sp. NKW23]
MLSRVAGNLFWMSRYIERAENVARLLDAGRRMNTLPTSAEARAAEWSSIVIAAGCSQTFPEPLEQANARSVAEHLIFDRENASSIRSCFHQARENARAVRQAITADVWDAANQAWFEMRTKSSATVLGGEFAQLLDWTKTQGHRFRGAIDDTLLRDPGYHFIRVGQYVERLDATMRLLDVKYHVLLPADEHVGGLIDEVQWLQILRAANSSTAYRHVYRAPVKPDLVVHFLVLNALSPRSLRHSAGMILRHLDLLKSMTGASHDCHSRIYALLGRLEDESVDDIFAHGLHEWLTERIEENHRLANAIADAYGFGQRQPEPVVPAEPGAEVCEAADAAAADASAPGAKMQGQNQG